MQEGCPENSCIEKNENNSAGDRFCVLDDISNCHIDLNTSSHLFFQGRNDTILCDDSNPIASTQICAEETVIENVICSNINLFFLSI